jgi:hypothetical protein
MSGKILNHLKSSVVGYLVLFLTLAGTASATHLVVRSSDIVDGEVTSVDVANNSLGGVDVANNSLASVDVAPDSLAGSDIAESTLSVKAMGCQSGKVRGFARVKGSASIGTTYTSNPSAIDTTNNCAAGVVQVRRAGVGMYFVKFPNNPAMLALAVANHDGASNLLSDNLVTVGPKIAGGADKGAFRVDVTDIDKTAPLGHRPQDGKFTIMLP